MAPSQLKQLKASIRERYTPNGQRNNAAKSNVVPQRSDSQKQRRPKSHSEELRRATLIPEMARRHKVGGIIDRRIGENDPTMTLEERMMQRYARQRSKRDSLFDLEEAQDDEGLMLTHLGRSVGHDDFNEEVEASDEEMVTPAKKKRRLSNPEAEVQDAEVETEGKELEKKKSRKEVMEEVIAKSKLYRYERQQAKEDDETLREELDKDLPDLLAILRGGSKAPTLAKQYAPKPIVESVSSIHPDRVAQMGIEDKLSTSKVTDKEYDARLKQMAQDKRAQPTVRTKTEEEKATEAAERLRELEAARLKRMRGEEEDDDDDDDDDDEKGEEAQSSAAADGSMNEEEINEAAAFGFKDAENETVGDGVEDEDDFIIDEELVASGSDLDFSDVSDESDHDDKQDGDSKDDDEFLKILEDRPKSKALSTDAKESSASSTLAYTYPCPQTHKEFLEIVKKVDHNDLTTVIQRIRALYHSSLGEQNKEKLAKFAVCLVDHIHYMPKVKVPLAVIENVIRHVHSLCKTYPDSVSRAFRVHLQRIYEQDKMDAGDLLILTAIGSIYPTSDHFHQVVTPAITIMARWLGLHQPQTSSDVSTGSYLVALCLRYQSLSKRYIPEAMNFVCAALIQSANQATVSMHIENIMKMTELWRGQSAFIEIFSPLHSALKKTSPSSAREMKKQLNEAKIERQPLELHHHRPLPIKSSIPKFEEYFNPDKHYDPDRERSEANKLRHEYKRERKGALRELRKDASFIARDKLKRKKEADRAYEEKQRKLIAEIQTEEGREKNAYEREKRARKGHR